MASACREGIGRIGGARCAGEVPLALIVGVEPEELVAEQRTADAEAPLLAPVLRLVDVGLKGVGVRDLRRQQGVGIRRAEVVVAIVEEELAVELVAAALGDGVDDAAGGASILGGVVRDD